MELTTPEEFAARMEVIARGGDTEGGHSEADRLMCEILTALGYGAGVEVFVRMDKWYA